MADLATNTFIAEGVIDRIMEPSTLSSGVPIQIVHVDVTDRLDNTQRIVPFSIRKDLRSLPDGLDRGDVVRIQFRLGSYHYGPDRIFLGANLRIGNIEVVHRAGEYEHADGRHGDDNDMLKFVEHLNQIDQNRRNNRQRG